MSETNPYQAPDAQVFQGQAFPTATMGWRLVNLLVDWVGIYALAFLVGVAMYLLDLGPALEHMNEYLLGALIALAYFLPQEALTGRTLGKLVSGTRVVTQTGEPIGWHHALKRTLVRFVPFEAFSFLTDSRPRGWHDRWSGTQVISLREKPPSARTGAQAAEE